MQFMSRSYNDLMDTPIEYVNIILEMINKDNG